jgi:hypothetical protein
MKKSFTILSLTLLLTLVQSNSANALVQLPDAKCNKKCQEEKKANKSTCALYTDASQKFGRSTYEGTSASRQFDKDEITNISATLRSKVSTKTRDDLEVYVNEYAYWLNFYATNVLPENTMNKLTALREIVIRSKRINPICYTK